MLTHDVAHELLDEWALMQLHYAPHWLTRWSALIDWVQPSLSGRSQPRLLDLGCGPGVLTWRLAQRLPTTSVLGLDADPALIAVALAGHPALPNLSFADGWAHESRADWGKFDAIVSSSLVHYTTTDTLERDLTALLDLIAPGGVVVHAEALSEFATQGPAMEPNCASGGSSQPNPWQDWWAKAAQFDLPSDPKPPVPCESLSRPVNPQEYVDAARDLGFTAALVEPIPGHEDEEVFIVLTAP